MLVPNRIYPSGTQNSDLTMMFVDNIELSAIATDYLQPVAHSGYFEYINMHALYIADMHALYIADTLRQPMK